MEQQILNYQIERLLGEGGMSRVYLGVDSMTGQKVAIKELLPHLANHDELRERFRREAQFMAKLSHPNIVCLIRYEEIGPRLILVQEYIEGITLEEYIAKQRGPIPEEEAEKLFCQLLGAFAYAHDNKVIHRDIKPSNILITKGNQVKVVDFGIARIAGGSSGTLRTRTGVRMGTVAYMSPEQVNGREVDERTDIYSLGVLLHQMLSGKAPYDMETESEFEVQVKIVKESLPRMKSTYEYVSDRVQRIVDKATAKEKGDRYRNCNDFMQAIKAPIPPQLQAQAKTQTQQNIPHSSQQNIPFSVNFKAVSFAVIVLLVIVVSGVMSSGKHDAPGEVPAAEAFIEPSAPAAKAHLEGSSVPVSHEIGEQYGGGIIFYLDESRLHGMIAALSDMSGQSDGYREGCFTWSDANVACNSLVIGNYRDWHLPTRDELHKLYSSKGVVGGFADKHYWSSTENSTGGAWGQNFSAGYNTQGDKTNVLRVRAVRYF